MKGLVFLGERRLGWLDLADPVPEAGEVIVEMKASGMCGSDLHPYRAPHDPAVELHQRRIAGHEPCGIVVAVGAGVAPSIAKEGDRVMVHHYHGCATCSHCRTGWPQLCQPRTRVTYSGNAHGAHAPYMRARADTLIPLHESLSFVAGAAISCGTGTAWGALERLRLHGTETIAVFGQGPVGLSATMLAAAQGARVIAIDVEPSRLELALRFGAQVVLNPRSSDVTEALRELTGGQGVDAALETSGASAAAAAGLQAVGVWGRVCLVGIGSTLNLEMKALLDRQVTVMTSYTMSTVGQQDCADFVVARQLPVERLFTHSWALADAQQAYELFDSQATGKAAFVF
jgi:threonine dehydrogenase-like Zn-dependent dehydrogenase